MKKMNDSDIRDKPAILPKIEVKSREIGFTMPSDYYIGSMLKTLIGSKPKSLFLELGTGIGLSLAWMADGMDDQSKLITIDNDPELIDIARQNFGANKQLEIICMDGSEWLDNYQGSKFDLIFADAWPGKYTVVNKALELVKVGGLYVIDDMLPQPNWLDGHQARVDNLIEFLENRKDFYITKLNWSTGIIIASKIH